jgi:hypothetical protein
MYASIIRTFIDRTARIEKYGYNLFYLQSLQMATCIFSESGTPVYDINLYCHIIHIVSVNCLCHVRVQIQLQ